MNVNLLSYLNAANPVVTTAIAQPATDSLMRHGISLVGLDGIPSLRDAMRDQALLPDTYLAIYVAEKDHQDVINISFTDTWAMKNVEPYRFGGNLLVHRATFEAEERFQYKELVIDGLDSGTDYYYVIKLFIAGEAQAGSVGGVITTYGTAYSPPNSGMVQVDSPDDDYKLVYDITEHDMSLAKGLIPRFEVVDVLLSRKEGRPHIVYRDVYDPTYPAHYEVEATAGGIFQRYRRYDIQIRYVAGPDKPVGVSPPMIIKKNTQIPWLNNFVDEVIIKGGGVDKRLLESAASKVSSLTDGRRKEMLEQISGGTTLSIGEAYTALLKMAALEDLLELEEYCDEMRTALNELVFTAESDESRGKETSISLDLEYGNAPRVFAMVTAPADIRGRTIENFFRFDGAVLCTEVQYKEDGNPSDLTKVTYMGKVSFERFFLNFNKRNA